MEHSLHSLPIHLYITPPMSAGKLANIYQYTLLYYPLSLQATQDELVAIATSLTTSVSPLQ